MTINVLVLTGHGINCEQETAHAFQLAGATPYIMHIDDFLTLESFDKFKIIAFPGGFSFGDEIRSGKIIAEKIKSKQKDNLENFIKKGFPIIGICNGFQILTELGIFKDRGNFSLAENIQHEFINSWIKLSLNESDSFWFKDINEDFFMPIRHKEGRITGVIGSLKSTLTYSTDVNGSLKNIAGLTNSQGNVLGLMPHPEAAVSPFMLPINKEKSNLNIKLFKNAVDYAGELNHV